MVMEKNSAAGSVKAGEVKLFDTTPAPRSTSELITGAHKLFAASRKGMQAAVARELDADVIAPTEFDVLTELMERAAGLMVDPAVETAGVSATVIMALMRMPEHQRGVYRCKEYGSTAGAVRVRF
jgi:hypothetical protein